MIAVELLREVDRTRACLVCQSFARITSAASVMGEGLFTNEAYAELHATVMGQQLANHFPAAHPRLLEMFQTDPALVGLELVDLDILRGSHDT